MIKTIDTSRFSSACVPALCEQTFIECFPGIELSGSANVDLSWTYCMLDEVMIGCLTSGNSSVSRTDNHGKYGDETVMVHIAIEGESVFYQNDLELDCSAGIMTFHSSNQAHTVQTSDRTETILIEFPLSFLNVPKEAYGYMWDLRSPSVGVLKDFVQSIFQQNWKNDLGAMHRLTYKNMIGGLIRRCLDLPCSKFSGNGGQLLRDIYDYVETNLADSSLSTSDIATELGISSRAVQSAFAKDGTTPSQFILDKRLNYAEAKLRQDIKRGDITSLAYESGFSDTSHFIRKFKRRFGVTPKQFVASMNSPELM